MFVRIGGKQMYLWLAVDAEGEVLEGDPKKVREVTDIWTFARDISSKNPNWKLVATESAN